jgi:hypothetical protein
MPDVWRMSYSLHVKDRMYTHAHAGSMTFSKHQACMYILSFTCREYGILQTSDMHVHPVFYMQGVWHSPNIRHVCTSCLLHAGSMTFSVLSDSFNHLRQHILMKEIVSPFNITSFKCTS